MVRGFEVIIIALGALLPFVVLLVVLGLLVWGGIRSRRPPLPHAR
jgi:hypothetical protein